jgi:twitching motility protein PilT
VHTLDDLLVFTAQNGASDLHISSLLAPSVRIDGDIHFIEGAAKLSEGDAKELLYSVMTTQQQNTLEHNLEIDFSFEVENVARFRANIFNQTRGLSGVFRVIPSKVLTLSDIKAPGIFEQIINQPRGIVLVTGPTGSGKSTTLAAMINHINANSKGHILTIEDPVEFVHEPIKCVVSQREVFRHTHGFSEALTSALREDPDVILVGEMRDLETIRLALTAAETGHLVFGTLHTSSASKTIDRIIDVFPAGEKGIVRSMLSESLRAVISQVLVKKRGGGRVAVHEIMLGSSAIKNLIREDKIPQMLSVMQTNNGQGMQTLDQGLTHLVNSGTILKETARSVAHNKEIFN